jgi:hypothetical protein
MPEDLDYILETTSHPRRFSSGSAYDPHEERSDVLASSEVRALMRRYTDSYRVAGFIVGVGEFFKIAGIVLGALIGVGALVLVNQTRNDQQQTAIFIVGVVIAGFLGGVLFLFGVLVSAQGQLLKASLDSAVNTSPFLTNDDRAKMMSLPKAKTTHSATMPNGLQNPVNQTSANVEALAASLPSLPLSTQSLVCRSCGSKVGGNVKFCGACGTRT